MGFPDSAWRSVKISDFGNVITGSTPSTKRPEFYGGKYPFITPTDIDNTSRYIDTARFLSEAGYKNQESRLLPAGAICVVCIGATIGKICMTHAPSFTNQQINSVVVDSAKYDNAFVYYLLNTQAEQIKGIAGGAATPIVNKTAFSNIEFRVPPLDTQRKIAAVLSAYDDLVENNTRRIQILEEMAQAIYRQWFVEYKFPGHKDVPLADSRTELGEIPEGWEVKRLGDKCTLVIGQSPRSEFYNQDGDGLPFHQGVKDFGERFPVHNVYCTLDKRIAEAGDILFSVRAPVGRINIADRKLIIGRGLHAIRHNSSHQWFIFHQLKARFFQEDMIGGGTIFKSVTKDDMLNIELIVPSPEIEKEFEQLLRPISAQIANLTKKNGNLRRTRDLLLPRLVSGEVDVSEVKIDHKLRI
jgi:type I restriction enzyme S subunit